MKNTNYKKVAQELYKEDSLLKAYTCAWKLQLSDFIHWYTDVQGKRRKSKTLSFFSNPFFYNTFLITQSSEWLLNEDAIMLWEYYLENQKDILLEFELYVAHNNPSLFIQGYKNKLTFIGNSIRLDKLKKENLPISVLNELNIWYKFDALLTQKWSKVKNEIENLQLLPYELCMEICASYEAFIYQNPDDKIKWHNAGETLSLLLAFVQDKYSLSKIDINKERLLGVYMNSVRKFRTQNIFKKAYEYVLIKDNTFRYAYEPGLKVNLEDDTLRFEESSSFNRQWEYDTQRYTLNEQLYYQLGERLFNHLNALNKIKYVNGNKSLNNQLGNTRKNAIRQAIYDLGIVDKDLKNNKLPTLDFMISFLHGIAWRKKETIEEPLHETARVRRNYYCNGVAELLLTKRVLEFIIISDKDILYDAAKSSGINSTPQEFHQLIDAFCFNWKSKEFNPFKMPVSLFQKPFIKIGKHIVSPIGIITSFTGLFTISESILKNFRPRDGKRIEEIIRETYDNSVWKTFLLEDNQEYGDVDVVMEDDENIIFMQLKRTTQKTNVLELHNQLPQDRKAERQLKLAKEVYNGGKKLHLWYVTTALEKVGTWNNEVYRVSCQDLIHAKRLLDLEGLCFNNLNDFIELIESDTLYKSILE